MKIPIKFAEIKTPLFLGNKNHKTKLDPGHIAGLSMEYDRTEKELLVTWNGETGIIPSSDVASMVEGIPTKKAVQHTHPMVAGIASAQVETPMGPVQHTHPMVAMGPVQHTHPMVAGIASAQVETPMGHVHAGPGHGKSGVGGKVK